MRWALGSWRFFFFFFQAEDGIRDVAVTGVQTCALPISMLPEVRDFHGYLTEMCRGAAFGAAVSATNYAVEGVAQKISEKALRGLAKNEKIGPRGRWWLEEHAKYDDEHPIQALEIIKSCVTRGETPTSVTDSARKSLALMKDAMVACYDS